MAAGQKRRGDNFLSLADTGTARSASQICPSRTASMEKEAQATAIGGAQIGHLARFRAPIQNLSLTMTISNYGADTEKL
jgi:hypothetical protein